MDRVITDHVIMDYVIMVYRQTRKTGGFEVGSECASWISLGWVW